MIVTGDEHGNIYMFKDVESVKENIGINMSGHTSPVQRIEFTKDDKTIVSLGAYDEAIFQWKISTIDPVFTTPGELHPED
jgi:WD40 repeat protein